MPLTPEQIKALLAQPQRRRKKNEIDTSVRDYQTWFKLSGKLFDESSPDGRTHCSNPNCIDTRSQQMVNNINGVFMCRRCFLDGYMLIPEGQLTTNE